MLDAKTGQELWRFQTGFGADAPPAVYEVNGEEYVAIGPTGPVADGVDTIKIDDNNVEYAYWPGRTRVKAGTAVTFTNVGDVQHTATAFEKGNWDTGVLEKGQSKTVTFSEPGNYYYICAPHPWMYGQVIVE